MAPQRRNGWRWGGAVLVAAALLAFPLVVADVYLQHLAILFLLWVTLGTSWNLLGGYAGQISFGHAAFFGMGAYTSSLLYMKAGFPPWPGMLLGGVAGMLLALPMGYICFRLRGPFFALSMLALSEFLRLVTLNWRDLTEGAVGILLPPFFISKLPYYYIGLALAAAAMLATRLLVNSKVGFYLVAIREDQDAAEALGIDTTRYKLVALGASAFFAAMAGSYYANYMAYIDPPIVFSIVDLSIAMILVAVLGGMGTLWGPVVGALLIVALSEAFRAYFAAAHLIVYGVLIIVAILFMPEGVVGSLAARWPRGARPWAAAGEAPAAGRGR